MFHPQLGVLNYLPVAGRPAAAALGIPSGDVIPSLVLVETWQWTPLVMLIVLGGLAGDPDRAYESRGNRRRQFLADVPVHHAAPDHAVVCIIRGMIRMIDAVKSLRPSSSRSRKDGLAPRRRPSTFISTASPSSLRSRLRIGDRSRVLCADRRACGRAVVPAAAARCGPRSAVAHEFSARSSAGSALWFAVFVIVSSGDPVLPLDGLAVAESRGRQRRLPSRCFFPERIAWKNYADVLASNRFVTYFVNSLIVTGSATLLAMLVACLPATASRGWRHTIRHRDPDRAHHAGGFLSHSAVPAVSVVSACSARCCRRSSSTWW